jgi:hypothetical protein
MRTPDAVRPEVCASASVKPDSVCSKAICGVERVPCAVTDADPWFMRPRRTHVPVVVADLWGHGRDIDAHRMGDTWTADFRRLNLRRRSSRTYPEIVRRLNTRDIQRTIARYEASGRFSEKELFLIRQAWLAGWSLRRIARAQGLRVSTVSERIHGNKQGHGGFRKKAPEFYAWWIGHSAHRGSGARRQRIAEPFSGGHR